EKGLAILQQEMEVDYSPGLPKEEIIKRIGEFDALMVRSGTKVTRDIIEAGEKLKIIGRAGVGVDNIDVEAATEKGIVVVNSPGGNTRAAAEHTIALMLALARNIPQAHLSLKQGEWKRSKFMGVEIYGKTLGIIGLGRIGREVAKRAQGLGMEVIAYDPYISEELAERLNIQLLDLESLLSKADIVTVHTPLTKETRHLLGEKELRKMKKGAKIINTARGGIIDEQALVKVIEEGILSGAAIDVFEQEPPPPDHPLLKLEQVIVTPHLGASTVEAQEYVAVDVAQQIVNFFKGIPPTSPVNLPVLPADILATIQPYIILMEKMGRLLAGIGGKRINKVEITYYGEISEWETDVLTRSLLKGLLEPVLYLPVNIVNAPLIAQNRGINVAETKSSSPTDYSNLITVEVLSDEGTKLVGGTVVGKGEPRIVLIDGYRVDFVPEGIILITSHIDKPGMIGKVGTILGKNDINIAGMNVGRVEKRGRAVMVLSVDESIPAEVLKEIEEIDGIERAWVVEF
ncbi:phosphoglycerate dehydrogenase, partial [bacterium]|nr:phosphoglycerate dehydrogenase [bacterium]